MMNNRWAMRRTILCKLDEHLQKEYSSSPAHELLVESRLGSYQIDAMCAFKSDPYLNELRSALVRLDDGTLGFCIRCKEEIRDETLMADPVRRVCEKCESALSCIVYKPVG